jgi:hypothetical protein
MATFKELSAQDIKTSRSVLNQLVDVIQNDISGSTSRKRFEVFVTGGIGPGVTSSMFQTVYDQDFSLQTANPVFDLAVGLWYSGSTVQDAKTGDDSSGKILFPSSSIQMREKTDVYRQFAQQLLGNATDSFFTPHGATGSADRVDEAMFVCFKRLFARDAIKRETFAMKFYQSASCTIGAFTPAGGACPTIRETNLNRTSISGSTIFTDVGAAVNQLVAFGGDVGNIVNSANTAEYAGVLFYDQGIAVFNMATIMSGTQHVSGAIDALNASAPAGDVAAGKMVIGDDKSGNPSATFIPDLMVSASIDDIVDHLASCRFSSGTLSGIVFQNNTNINSTLIYCRASADEFNYSSNPTYVDSDSRIIVIDEGQESNQLSFTFLTTIGLYDANDNLLAVAKLSRPVEKNPEKDMTFRIRLDY